MTIEEAIKELKDASYSEARYGDKDNHRDEVMKRIDAFDMAIQVLVQTRWIPCSERLPEREGWYLTSLGDKTYGGADVDMYCKGWVKYGTHVLAWMPLPEPYKTECDKQYG